VKARTKSAHLLGAVGGRLVALELPHVKQVLAMMLVEPCPGGPKALLGFANLGGEPVPVLALRVLFGLREVEDAFHAVDQRLVVCVHRGRQIGLVLDEIEGLGEATALRAPSVDDRIVAVEVVRGIGLVGDRLCVVVDPAVAIDWLTRVIDVPALDPVKP
jgi:chemotaxis signal transduction protein